MKRLALLLLCVGCGKYPFENDPPELDRLNGYRAIMSQVGVEDVPDESGRLELVIEAHDAEGDPVEVWFPYAPEGFDFDPHGSEGHWDVPEELTIEDTYMVLVLRDQHGEHSRSKEFYIDFFGVAAEAGVSWGDTGITE